MPIVSIQIVGERINFPGEKKHIQNLANSLGKIFKSPPGTTWVKLVDINQIYYAENDIANTKCSQPVFVEVLKRTLEATRELAEEAEQIVKAVAKELNKPEENVHILYLPAGEGRIAFGGKL